MRLVYKEEKVKKNFSTFIIIVLVVTCLFLLWKVDRLTYRLNTFSGAYDRTVTNFGQTINAMGLRVMDLERMLGRGVSDGFIR